MNTDEKNRGFGLGSAAGGQGRGFFLLSLGCAKNQVESEHLAGQLLAAGWEARAEPDQAELLLVNTCGFIQEAVEENLEAILELDQARSPGQRLVVAGCLVGRYGKKLAESLSEADLLIGPGEVHRLAELVAGPAPAGRIHISRPTRIFGADDPRPLSTGPGWAYLRIADGCTRGCAFCTIGAIRGANRSRTVEDLVIEARRLAEAGVVELNLIAQDLTAYGQDLYGEPSLPRLLEALEEVDGISWIRALYLHPDYLDLALVERMLSSDKVLPYFDLPLQHIADPVLASMGRKKSGHELRGLLIAIRGRAPQAFIRATVMTGHPGEGEAEFDELISFVRAARLDRLGCFAFSPEAGARSARMECVSRAVAEDRRDLVMALQREISREKLAELVGGEQELLVLGEHPESELLGHGRLAGQAPEVDGSVIIIDGQAEAGCIARCRITASHDYDLEAELI